MWATSVIIMKLPKANHCANLVTLVAKWFVLKLKIPIRANIWGFLQWKTLVYFMPIWYTYFV
jgi:hypothetical protein